MRQQLYLTRRDLPAAEREGNILKYFKDVCLENGSSQGQNLAFTVLFVPNSLKSGLPKLRVAFLSEGSPPCQEQYCLPGQEFQPSMHILDTYSGEISDTRHSSGGSLVW